MNVPTYMFQVKPCLNVETEPRMQWHGDQETDVQLQMCKFTWTKSDFFQFRKKKDCNLC